MKPSNDREAISLILSGMVEAGCIITGVVDDTWNMSDVTEASAPEEATDLVTAVDEAYVYLTAPVDTPLGPTHGWVRFVLGNDPEEVAADYTVSLSKFLEPIVRPWWA